MRFDATQRFKTSVEQLLTWFTDPDFYPTLGGLPQISVPEVVGHSVKGSTVRLDLHLRYTGDLPSAALTFIDPDKLSWVEQLVFDLDAATATTRLLPDHYPDRLTCTGTYSFTGDGDRAVRRLDGDLKVRVPLVGGRVEKALVSGLQEHAAAEQELIAGRLTQGGKKDSKKKDKPAKGDKKR